MAIVIARYVHNRMYLNSQSLRIFKEIQVSAKLCLPENFRQLCLILSLPYLILYYPLTQADFVFINLG